MVEKTLTQIRLGGIYDQLGFGFHRYSTDVQWLVPQFEKMLYDQAILIMAYTEAYQATGKVFYAGVAEEIIINVLRDMTAAEGGFFSAEDANGLNQQMLSHFWDEKNGGLYMTADDSEKLLVRSKVIYDGAIPSGNSVAVFNLLRLGHMNGSTDNLTKAERIIQSFAAEVEQHLAGHSQLMVALEFALNPNYEVVIVGQPQKKDTISMLAALHKPFLPEKVVFFRPADLEAAAEVTGIAPFTKSMAAKNGQATAYVCREFACKLPTTSIEQMLENLRQN